MISSSSNHTPWQVSFRNVGMKIPILCAFVNEIMQQIKRAEHNLSNESTTDRII